MGFAHQKPNAPVATFSDLANVWGNPILGVVVLARLVKLAKTCGDFGLANMVRDSSAHQPHSRNTLILGALCDCHLACLAIWVTITTYTTFITFEIR